MFWHRKKNILITGAKGQLGSYLVKELTKLSFKKKSNIGQIFGIDIDDLDLRNAEAVADFFNVHVIDPSVKLDYVIHCAAATNTSAIEQDPWKFYRANVIATRNIAESCAYNKIKLIHISTDYVFSEWSPKYFNDHKLEFPVNQYGLQKLLAEKEVQLAYAKRPKDFVIGRLSWLFGNSSNTFIEKLLRSIANTYKTTTKTTNGKISHFVANDAYGRPTPVNLVLSCILDVIYNNLHGVMNFQYDNNPQISRYDWASMIWSIFCEEALALPKDDISDDMRKTINDMKTAISIVGVDSSELKLNMHHPGLVVVHTLNKSTNPYLDCTADYIVKNIKNLLSLIL